ncbi:uncharacterized protein LOC114304735, partial [Camellia sinensis]|uniref:uncharacterized protein LOC114304735 n=1 Tax=Camellia sinensis TaxID=4442 RepID=UPI0010368914
FHMDLRMKENGGVCIGYMFCWEILLLQSVVLQLVLQWEELIVLLPSTILAGTWIIIIYWEHPGCILKHTFLKEMYIEGNAFRPGVNPIGVHHVLEVSDTEFLF